MIAISGIHRLIDFSRQIMTQRAALGCALFAMAGAGAAWTATRKQKPRSVPCLLKADLPGGPWVPVDTRKALNLQAPPPEWCTWERLEACTVHMKPHIDYIWGSGWPIGAGGGADEDANYLFARTAIIRGFAAKIVLAETLGNCVPGEILAIPGPTRQTFGFEHPFMQVIRGQNIGLLVRLTTQDSVNYWESDYWTNLEDKPDELVLETWPDFGVLDNDQFFDFVLEFARQADKQFKNNFRVGIHCRGGLGRTGTLIAAYIIKKQIDSGSFPDPFGAVLEIRRRRLGLVQTQQQFLQLYDFARDYKES